MSWGETTCYRFKHPKPCPYNPTKETCNTTCKRYHLQKEDEMVQWTCPDCGASGGNPVSRAPFCHVCDYKVTMKRSSNGRII